MKTAPRHLLALLGIAIIALAAVTYAQQGGAGGSARGGRGGEGGKAAEVEDAVAAATAITANDRFVYVVHKDVLYQLRAGDLGFVKQVNLPPQRRRDAADAGLGQNQ